METKNNIALEIQTFYQKRPKNITNRDIKNFLEDRNILPKSKDFKDLKFFFLEEKGLSRVVFSEFENDYNQKKKMPELYGYQEFLDLLNLRGYSQQTIKNYKNAIIASHKWCYQNFKKSLKNANKKNISEFLSYLVNEKNSSYSFLRNHRFALDAYFNEVVKKNYKINELAKIKKGKYTPTILTRDEINKVLKKLDNSKHRLIVSLIYSSGLRTSEAINLKVKDVDFEKSTLTIRSRKTKVGKHIAFSEGLKDALKEFMSNKTPNSYLFISNQGSNKYPIHTRTVQKEFQSALNKANIQKKVTPNDLRHTFATHLLESGADLEYIKSLLGHKSIATTSIYTKIANPKAKKAKSPLELGNKK